MDALSCARELARPIGDLGSRFYFAPSTRARAKELGLRSVEYYGLGRAGVLGDVAPQEVLGAFAFFSPTAIEHIYANARASLSPVTAAAHYLASAEAYATESFAGLEATVLTRVSELGERVLAAAPVGRYRLFDGYRAMRPSTGPAPRAYRVIVELRELRGGAHIDAVAEAGLSAAEASYLEDPENYALHGFGPGDVGDAARLVAAAPLRALAEAATDATMAEYYAVLSGPERDEFVAAVAVLAGAGHPRA